MTKTQLEAAIAIHRAFLETIEDMGEDGAPLGPMYAGAMGKISYESFMQIIANLEKAQRITVRNHVAYAIKR